MQSESERAREQERERLFKSVDLQSVHCPITAYHQRSLLKEKHLFYGLKKHFSNASLPFISMHGWNEYEDSGLQTTQGADTQHCVIHMIPCEGRREEGRWHYRGSKGSSGQTGKVHLANENGMLLLLVILHLWQVYKEAAHNSRLLLVIRIRIEI